MNATPHIDDGLRKCRQMQLAAGGGRWMLADIANICGCTPETIRLIELRALGKLRAALQHREPIPQVSREAVSRFTLPKVAKPATQGDVDLSPERIRDIVCEVFGVSVDRLLSHCKLSELVSARHALNLILVQDQRMSRPQIARVMNRDQSGITYSFHAAEDHYETDEEFRAKVEEVRRRLREPGGSHQ